MRRFEMQPRLVSELEKVEDFKLGSGFLIFKNSKGSLLGVGDNRLGQCGFGDDTNFSESPSVIRFQSADIEVSQMACGLQYTLVLDSSLS